MSGYLTTHVLDTTTGKPAAGLPVELFAIEDNGRRHLKSLTTNADGRTDEPLLASVEFVAGVYEIVFDVGGYFAAGRDLPDPPFLDLVPIRFGVADPGTHLHIPLLASPYSYSTYRGS